MVVGAGLTAVLWLLCVCTLHGVGGSSACEDCQTFNKCHSENQKFPLLPPNNCQFDDFEAHPYKAASGEQFVLNCTASLYPGNLNKDIKWFKHHSSETQQITSGNDNFIEKGKYLWFTEIEARHSGLYSCAVGDNKTYFYVDVIEKNMTSCHNNGESQLYLQIGASGVINCPGVSCYSAPQNVSIQWDKHPGVLFSKRAMTVKSDQLKLYTIYEQDSGNYICDFYYKDNFNWTVRRVIQVNVIERDTDRPPQILYPYGNKAVEVELGKPFELSCKVLFGFEVNFNPTIKWLSYSDNSSATPLEIGRAETVDKTISEVTIKQTARLEEVNKKHLEVTFICFAQNSKGNATATLKLKKKPTVAGVLYIIGPIMTVVTTAVFCVLVRVHWIEIVLVYRNYFPFNETIEVGKEYDAFVSYVSTYSSEGDSGLAEFLHHLPQVLEKQCGYRLCLLERDVLPGGAYTEDIVSTIKRCRTAICVLCPCYFNSPCLFEMETALQTLLEEKQFKVILVKYKTFTDTHSLPPLVSKALRVLPAIHWNPSESSSIDSKFWKDLRCAMPERKIRFPSQGAEDVNVLMPKLSDPKSSFQNSVKTL
ncbi:interleukin-18 receptor accessory protein [Amia ocellicauda]|uniref:interleukin-18 receptor accessory protein n=1 Tax=Amia ocellicauda TaxID=2972642 RepID=UPI0034644AE6